MTKESLNKPVNKVASGALTAFIIVFLLAIIALPIIAISIPSSKDRTSSETDIYETTIESTEINNTESIQSTLIGYGYSEEQATTLQEQLNECGIVDLSDFRLLYDDEYSTPPDGFVTFMNDTDSSISLWVIIDAGQLYYVALNGIDIYSSENGGLVSTINDVLENIEVTDEQALALREMTEAAAQQYFQNYFDYFPYVDPTSFDIRRDGSTFVVQCFTARNITFTEDFHVFQVTYTLNDDSTYSLTNIEVG